MMFLREGYNETFTNNAMSISGIFTDMNMDAAELKTTVGKSVVSNRRTIAEEVTRDGTIYYRYNIITPVNHGLARQNKPLPSGIPIQLTFNRALSTKGLLQITDKDSAGNTLAYSEKSIPLIDPTLSCYFVESTKAEEFYAKTKMYDVSVDYLDFSLRRELLMNSVSEHKIKVFEGNDCADIVYRQTNYFRSVALRTNYWYHETNQFRR